MEKVATKDSTFRMRVATSKKASWRLAAAKEGLSLAAWIEEACDSALAEVNALKDKVAEETRQRSVVVSKAYPAQGRTAVKGVKGGLCEHRNPAESYCPHCGS